MSQKQILLADDDELFNLRQEQDDEIASHIQNDEYGCIVCMPEDPNLPQQ